MEARSHLLDSQTAAIQLAQKKKKDHDISNLSAEPAPFYSHTHRRHKHPEHMVPSAKHSTEDKVKDRGVLLEELTAGGPTSA